MAHDDRSTHQSARRGPHLVILTGSGISAESGIATFRDAGGIWARYDISEVATPEAFATNPGLVHDFYNHRRSALAHVEPNPAHYALARLETALSDAGGSLTLVTQNVDDLHTRAGSARVIHMHGELLKRRCLHCGVVSVSRAELSTASRCDDCGQQGRLRPHIVWFGEMPMHMDDIETALAGADQFVSIGTSGSVYPAAGFVFTARAHGIACTELNLEASDNADAFSEARYGRASEIVPQWVDAFIGDRARRPEDHGDRAPRAGSR